MTLTKQNIAANFVGSAWQSAVVLLSVPLYIGLMGIESYGLVGLFATFQAVSGLLDMGLNGTLSREMARLSVLQEREHEMRNLVRTLETAVWCVALLIGISTVAIAPLVAHFWIKSEHLRPTAVAQALSIMGFALALQWPSGFYSGGLMGLEKQVLLNAINMAMGALRAGGAVLVLWLLSPTVHAFFVWQMVASTVSTATLAIFLWRSLPKCATRATFQVHLFKEMWRFAAGISAITLLATILSQLDKVILSKLLPLEMFGYYSLAGVVATGLYRLIAALAGGVYPRLTQLVALHDDKALADLYHRSCQAMSVLTLSVAVVVALFPYEILLLWTRNAITAANAYRLVAILICAAALNGMIHLPNLLQLAYGWTRQIIFINLAAVVFFVPLVLYMTQAHGAIGGASAWLILNGVVVLATVHFMHLRVLRGEEWRWYSHDVFLPLAAAVIIGSFGRALMSALIPQAMTFTFLVIISGATLTGAGIVTPSVRKLACGGVAYLRRVVKEMLSSGRRSVDR